MKGDNLPKVYGMDPIRSTEAVARILGVSPRAIYKAERKALAKIARAFTREVNEARELSVLMFS